uniref:hypothetical protein n=1 Tax=Alistipes sp. TaxID=1872444 RepID=UPI004057BD68
MARQNNKTTAAAQPKTVQMSAAHKVAQGLFAANKTLNEVHITSDGTAFYSKSDANNHARTLKDKAVATVKRSDLAASPVKEEKPAPAPVKEGEGENDNDNPAEGNEEGDKDDNPDKE